MSTDGTKGGSVASSFLTIAERWGLFAALTVAFIWMSHLREKTLNQRLDKQDVFIQETLLNIVKDVRKNTNSVRKMKEDIQEVVVAEAAEDEAMEFAVESEPVEAAPAEAAPAEAAPAEEPAPQ